MNSCARQKTETQARSNYNQMMSTRLMCTRPPRAGAMPRLAAAATGTVGLVAGALYLIRRLRLRSEAIASAALPGPRGTVSPSAFPGDTQTE